MTITVRAGSTTNLNWHIRIVHPIAQLEERRQVASTSTDSDVSGPKSTSTAAAATSSTCITPFTANRTKICQFIPKQMSWTTAIQHSIYEELARMIVSDFPILSIVEDKGFKSLVKALNLAYILASRKTVPNNEPKTIWHRRCIMARQGGKKAPSICLTTDLQNHLFFQVHHLSHCWALQDDIVPVGLLWVYWQTHCRKHRRRAIKSGKYKTKCAVWVKMLQTSHCPNISEVDPPPMSGTYIKPDDKRCP